MPQSTLYTLRMHHELHSGSAHPSYNNISALFSSHPSSSLTHCRHSQLLHRSQVFDSFSVWRVPSRSVAFDQHSDSIHSHSRATQDRLSIHLLPDSSVAPTSTNKFTHYLDRRKRERDMTCSSACQISVSE